MMNLEEQNAFLDAYAYNVADASREDAKEFLKRYVNGETIDYSSDYTSIMDALGVWHSAIMFALTRDKK
jgi:hypothetical protein